MTSAHPNDAQIRALYAQFLDGWNRRSGAAVAAAFADDGDIIGYDGTHHHGRLAIAADFRQIFGSHPTAAYVAVIRSVRPVAPGVAVQADASAIGSLLGAGAGSVFTRQITPGSLARDLAGVLHAQS